MNASLTRALACPVCRGQLDAATLRCTACAITYADSGGVPLLLAPNHPWHQAPRILAASEGVIGPTGHPLSSVPRPLRGLAEAIGRHTPEERLWSARSRRAVQSALEQARKDTGHLIVNLGSAPERVFRDAYASVPEVVRIGMPQAGRVDAFGDVTALPLLDDSVGLFLSCSVLEHVVDPDDGVAEMARVIHEGGLVYAEIPFMRSYHMAPIDFQRYTISGIERLFERHGFEVVEKGVCSGPFTAMALFAFDTVWAATRSLPGWLATAISGSVYFLVHPLKYLDRLVESSRFAEHQACNFYYLGRRAA